MEQFGQYLIKFTLTLSVSYLFYLAVLSRLTFYHLNRIYLLLSIVSALVFPFIDLSHAVGNGRSKAGLIVKSIPTVSTMQELNPTDIFQWHSPARSHRIGFPQTALLIYGAGILFLLIRLLIQFLSFRSLKKHAKLMQGGKVKIYHVEAESISPFCLGRSIYLNKRLHEPEELEDVILHEYVHIKEYHLADLLLAEFICILNWFNPLAWLVRGSIRQNLEFKADMSLLRSGKDTKSYQYHLLKNTGKSLLNFCIPFNSSPLKERIRMMTREPTGKVHLFKFLFLFPVFALTLLACRTNKFDPENSIFLSVDFRPYHHGDTLRIPSSDTTWGDLVGDKTDRNYRATVTLDSLQWIPNWNTLVLRGHLLLKDKKQIQKGRGAIAITYQPDHLNDGKLLVFDDEVWDGRETNRRIRGKKFDLHILPSDEALKKYGTAGKNGAQEFTSL